MMLSIHCIQVHKFFCADIISFNASICFLNARSLALSASALKESISLSISESSSTKAPAKDSIGMSAGAEGGGLLLVSGRENMLTGLMRAE